MNSLEAAIIILLAYSLWESDSSWSYRTLNGLARIWPLFKAASIHSLHFPAFAVVSQLFVTGTKYLTTQLRGEGSLGSRFQRVQSVVDWLLGF